MKTPTALILAGLWIFAAALVCVTQPHQPEAVTVKKSDRQAVMLRTCFPGGIYKADAASTCPAFKDFITTEADKAEKIIAKE